MSRVDLKIGFNCNNACAFCVQGQKRKRLPARSRTEIEKSLLTSYREGRREVVFTGGEPCLHPDFFELVQAARRIGYEAVQIQTNGRMFSYPDFCRRAIAAGATEFSPALHGPVPAVHDRLTQVPGSFSQTVRGIRNLKDLGQRVITNTVITATNYRRLPELAELLIALGADQFQFAFIHISGSAEANKDWIVPKKSAAVSYIKRGLDIARRAGVPAMVEAVPYCLLIGYEEHVSEQYIPKTKVYDADLVVPEYERYRAESGKAKRAECRQCRFDPVCEGPWKEYPENFGWDEFRPIKK